MLDWWAWIVSELSALLPLKSGKQFASNEYVFDGLDLQPRPIDNESNQRTSKAKGNAPIRVILSNNQALVRRISKFSLPLSQTRTMAEIDLSSSTPLQSWETELFFENPLRSSNETYYLIMKTAACKGLGQLVRNRQLKPWQIELVAKGRHFTVEREAIERMGLATKWNGPQQRTLAIAVVATLALYLATFGHEYWRMQQANLVVAYEIRLAEAKTRTLAAQTRQRQERLKQVEAVRSARSEQIPISTVWEELTRLIPDSAWITELSINTREITFSGFARSAAGLIPALETSKFFKNPAIAGRVLRSSGTTRERFTIRLEPQV